MIYYSARTDLGFGRMKNEDFVSVTTTIGSDDVYLFLLADGEGAPSADLQPAALVCGEIKNYVEHMWKENNALVKENTSLVLSSGFRVANRVLGGLQLGNQEMYAGFSSVATGCIVVDDKLTFAHCGNSRLYLLRNGKLKQLTDDHTAAADLVKQGVIPQLQYYTHPDRLKLTSGLGAFAEPLIQRFSLTLKQGDMVLMTTDGIHNAIVPEFMTEILMSDRSNDEKCEVLIEAAISQKYNDNMSAMILQYV